MALESRFHELNVSEILTPSETSVSPQAIDALSAILCSYNSPDDVYNSLGKEALNSIMIDADPELQEHFKEGQQKLDGEPGHFILKRTGLEKLSLPLAQLTAIAVSSFFGHPTKPSPRSPVIAWPIDYTAEDGTPGLTFSQTNAEATMHTDTQYFSEPEPYFGLFCIKPAKDGGGMSQVIDSRIVLNNLAEVDGEDLLTELARPFPFRVPAIFTKDPHNQLLEITWAPIVSSNGIRYRKDTLVDALSVDGISVPDTQLSALEIFEEALTRAPVTNYNLGAGDVLFVNNHRLLHGRTAFQDPDRLMLRVRVK